MQCTPTNALRCPVVRGAVGTRIAHCSRLMCGGLCVVFRLSPGPSTSTTVDMSLTTLPMPTYHLHVISKCPHTRCFSARGLFFHGAVFCRPAILFVVVFVHLETGKFSDWHRCGTEKLAYQCPPMPSVRALRIVGVSFVDLSRVVYRVSAGQDRHQFTPRPCARSRTLMSTSPTYVHTLVGDVSVSNHGTLQWSSLFFLLLPHRIQRLCGTCMSRSVNCISFGLFVLFVVRLFAPAMFFFLCRPDAALSRPLRVRVNRLAFTTRQTLLKPGTVCHVQFRCEGVPILGGIIWSMWAFQRRPALGWNVVAIW